MIKITFCKQFNQTTSVTLTGHANSSQYGEDIVCAAVSTLVITSVNFLIHEKLLDESNVDADEAKGGYLFFECPPLIDLKDLSKRQWTLDQLEFGLKEIAKEYGKYVSVQEKITD